MVSCTWSLSTKLLVVAVLVLPALIFWIWLIVESIRPMYDCPKKCWCNTADTIVDCSNASLQDIPSDLHKGISHLTLSHNNISILRKNHFYDAGLVHLEMLTLEYNGIFVIEPGAFNGLPMLSNLHLKENNLTELQKDTFLNMSKLSGLHIAGNQIKVLPAAAFQGLENLGYVSLEGNELIELHEDNFIGLGNLQNLWLSDNNLTHLHPDVFKYLPKLQLISLRGNKNLYVPSDRPFLNVPSLSRYILSECNIATVSAKTFEKSPNLSYIDLDNNSISTLNVELVKSLPKLKEVHLFGNPLKCDCELREVWTWCRKYDIVSGFRYNVPKCHTPDEVSGLWWGVLEKANCSDVGIEFQDDYKSIDYEYVSFDPEFESYLNFMKYVESSIYAVLFLFGTIGNVTVMIIIGCNKRMRIVPNAYIFNLAVSDLLSLFINLPLSHAMALSPYWPFGDFMCKVTAFFRVLSIGVSSFSVAVLSIQRNYATSGSVNLSSKRATIITITAVWLIACLCALPSAFSVRLEYDIYCSVHHNMEFYKMTTTFYLLAYCIVPMCIITSMYYVTAQNLVRIQQMSEEDEKRCKTLAKIVIGLAFVFFISFVPYHVVMAVIVWRDPSFGSYIGYLIFVSVCLLALNPCLNPVSLCFTSVTFKKMFKHYLFCCCRHKSSKEDEDSDFPESKEVFVRYVRDLPTEVVNFI